MKHAAKYTARRTLLWLPLLPLICFGAFYIIDRVMSPIVLGPEWLPPGHVQSDNFYNYAWLDYGPFIGRLWLAVTAISLLALTLIAAGATWLISNPKLRRTGYALIATLGIAGLGLTAWLFMDSHIMGQKTCERWYGNSNGDHYALEVDCDDFRDWMERSF